MHTVRKRILYLITTIFLLTIEVLIALYVNDHFIRPYLGDMLVVIVIYTFVRIFVPESWPLLTLAIFIFAVFVEILQWFHIVDVLGLSDSRFFSVLIGGVFDWKDILCYGLGCAWLRLYEYAIRRKHKKHAE
ncbi:MAG: DUF2809 domain-containing protein [Lachnospiraceae bacterium]|nr:DUF2809 domain-containing protein [Lachnospiraceae bacterium]MBR1853659.1 DUF2809 domain-containing protein [Lachnospiraceae bacterium]